MLYQQHTLGADIAVIDDAGGDEIVGRISLGDELVPDSVALSPDNAVLYVNGVNRFEFWQNPTREARSVFAAFDARSFEELWRIPLHGFVEHYRATRDRRYFYVAHYDRKLVSRVDTETREILPITIANMGGHKVRLSPDESRLYVGSIVWGSLDVVDTAEAKWERMRTFEHNVRPFAVSPDGSRLYVQLSRLHGFHVVDAQTLDTLEVVEHGGLDGELPPTEDHYPFTTDHGVEITPDGRLVVFLATTGDFAAVYALPDLKPLAKIPVGREPSYLTITQDSQTAYVSCRRSNAIYVLDLDALEVGRVIENTGAFPQRVCADH